MITVGVLTPHAAAGPDAEFPLIAPEHVRVQMSRIQMPPSSRCGRTASSASSSFTRHGSDTSRTS